MSKKSTKTKSETTPWAPMQPHILGAANYTTDIVRDNQPNLNAISGWVQGNINPLGERAFGDQPGLREATGYASDVLGGKYLNGNPHIDRMAALARDNAAGQVNSTFSMAGRTGGGNHAEALGRGLSQAELGLRHQDYGQERERMGQAGALLPALTAAQYAGVQPYLATAELGGTLPYAGVGAMAPILGGASGAGTTTGRQPGGWGNALLGGIAGALPYLSDRRAKQNIAKVGEFSDGLGIYSFEYKPEHNLPGTFRGVMADEVKELRPHAYIADMGNGLSGVDYGRL